MRKNELKKDKSIWITKEVHSILRKEKLKSIEIGKGKSMMRIVNDLVINKYKK